MTLDTTRPSDQVLIASLASYIREDRAAINSISGSGNVGVTEIEVGIGVTDLTVGIDLGTYGLEVVIISGAAAVTLDSILGGTQGQVKVLVFQDNNVDITDGTKANGEFYLNHLPALSDFEGAQDDVLVLVNVGGDGGATTHGYWKELYRTISVK